MKYFSLILFFVLIFAFAVSAQTDQTSDCPTVSVRGGGAPRLNEISYFTADIDKKGKDLKIEYIWTVKGGKITKGQGTETIAVKVSGEDELIATVEIKGFPEGCQNISTEWTEWHDKLQAFKIGDFLNFNTPTEKTQLEELRNEIPDNPNAQVYVIRRFKKNTSPEKISRKLRKIGRFLMKEFTLEAGGITMIYAFGEREYTEIWLVPPGADNPEIR